MSRHPLRVTKNLDTTNDGLTSDETTTFANIAVGTEVYHDGDDNTKLAFQTDNFRLDAGGVEFINGDEDTQDTLTFNGDSGDMDITFNATSGSWLTYVGGTDVITLHGAQVTINEDAESVTVAGAASVTKRKTILDSTAGTFALTLAAPDSSMIGQVKIIEMTVDNGDVTLALTNVQGGSAATTATFADVNDALMLVGGTNKWHVIGESGVALT